eukprot:g24532.t1
MSGQGGGDEASGGEILKLVKVHIETIGLLAPKAEYEVLLLRAQVLYKAVSEPPFGFTDAEEATLGAVDAVDHIRRCAGVEGFSWFLGW